LPIACSAETLLLVVEGTLTVVWRDTTGLSTELGEGDTASTNPPGRRGAAGRRRGRHRPRPGDPELGCAIRVASCNPVRVELQLRQPTHSPKETEYAQDNPDH